MIKCQLQKGSKAFGLGSITAVNGCDMSTVIVR